MVRGIWQAPLKDHFKEVSQLVQILKIWQQTISKKALRRGVLSDVGSKEFSSKNKKDPSEEASHLFKTPHRGDTLCNRKKEKRK